MSENSRDRGELRSQGVRAEGASGSPMGMSLMRTFWRDEHGHLYRVCGTTGFGDDDTTIRLEWVAPERQTLSYRELKQHFQPEETSAAPLHRDGA
jgi:hypothetical protein